MLRVKPSDEVLPERVRAARHHAGMNQQELADRLGVSKRSVQNWEARGARRPRSKYMRRLSEATGKPIAWFYGEEAA